MARADAEAAQVRAEDARVEAEEARAEADRARQEAELGRERSWLLAEAGRRMAESMDWEATVEAVVRSAVPDLADWTSLTIVDGRRLRVVAVAHSDPQRERLAWELVRRHPRDIDRPRGAANVIRTGQVELVEDLSPEVIRAAAEDPEHLRQLENLNVRHYAIAPLTTPSGVIGALTFVLGDSGRRFAPEDLQLITGLAARAALHVQNSRLDTERSHVAQILQASLRPRGLPSIPGAEVAAQFHAAGDQTEVGGDFYDIFRSEQSAWTAIIGDVVGKGPEAAASTGLAPHTLRTASMLSPDPAAKLSLLNQALHADATEHLHCTACYLRLCPADRGFECRLANAGHPSPILVRQDGSIASVDGARGPLLGAFPDPEYREEAFRLAPGELLLMYTDGVTDVGGADPASRERELARVVAASAGRSADDVVERVHRYALASQHGQPADDIAVLSVRALNGR